MKKIRTLCILHNDQRILLGLKKRGFGEGRWNGFGGKIEKGENVEEAARREVLEEVGLNVQKLQKLGVVEFAFQNKPDIYEVHVFGTSEFTGLPKETEEMRPAWFRAEEMPFDAMWPEARQLFPRFLKGERINGKIFYDEAGNSILRQELQAI